MFEVVSIRRNAAGRGGGGGMRSLPDGSFMMTNQPIESILLSASPEPVRAIENVPSWARDEAYDINAKAPSGSSRADQRDMMQQPHESRWSLCDDPSILTSGRPQFRCSAPG